MQGSITGSMAMGHDGEGVGLDSERAELTRRARELGFAEVGITAARLDARARARLREFVAEGQHGTMDWFSRRIDERLDPRVMWDAARTAIVLAVEYTPRGDASGDTLAQMKSELGDKSGVVVAHYARGEDYHGVMKKRLKIFARWLCSRYRTEAKVFVDTAPISEKVLAARSGIGWQGKNTQLVSRAFGCWLFLGIVLTSREFPDSEEVADSCGSCSRCMDICPTGAFPRPYVLDARRCISYLTIEHRGMIPRAFRVAIGNRVFGCDDCLTVCPWNKFARASRELGGRSGGGGDNSVRDGVDMVSLFSPRIGMGSARIGDWLGMDEVSFRRFFRGSPIRRLGFCGLRRNLLIAAGNSGDCSLLGSIEDALGDMDEVVRGSAVWAYWRLVERSIFCSRGEVSLGIEGSAIVREEWLVGMGREMV